MSKRRESKKIECAAISREFLALRSKEKWSVIAQLFSYLPLPTKTDNGDGTYTYTLDLRTRGTDGEVFE